MVVRDRLVAGVCCEGAGEPVLVLVSVPMAFGVRMLALALSVGAALEQAADPDAFGGREVAEQMAQVLEPLARPSAPVPAAGPAGP